MMQAEMKIFNQLSSPEAEKRLLQCCTAERWVAALVQQRPFKNLNSLLETADDIWAGLSEADYLQAFAGHPKIGDLASLNKKYAHTGKLAAGEQAATALADEATLQALVKANSAYAEKFGFIFIVCASGKSAAEMLALLNARINNSRTTELANAAEEQRKIYHLRLHKLAESCIQSANKPTVKE